MKRFVVLAAATALVSAGATSAPAFCPDAQSVGAITAPTGASVDCQLAISKEAGKYVKSAIKAHGGCIAKSVAGTVCYGGKEGAKAEKAANKALDKIAGACADTSGLAGTYTSADAADVGSCILGQHNASADVYIGLTHGIAGSGGGGSTHEKCASTLRKEAGKYLPTLLKTIDKCIKTKLSEGDTGDIVGDCIGDMPGAGAYTSPADAKTADGITKAADKLAEKLAKACDVGGAQIESLYACPDAETVDDLVECVQCSAMSTAFDIYDQQYNETGTFVAAGAASLTSAIGAANPGDKLLLQGGEYVTTGNTLNELDNLSIVGCGGATNDRPHITPDAGASQNGLSAAATDGLHFQSLSVEAWEDNGIFVTGADGVSFRDIIGDGGDATPSDPMDDTTRCPDCTVYAVFPVESNNVVVETSEVRDIKDAGIYVGSSTNIVVRFNRVYENVTGVEIENSEFADVYNNLAYDNTGGLLSFKLVSPPKQEHGFHRFFHNVSVHNNLVNFGIPGTTVSTVPKGTGFMIISDSFSEFRQNWLTDNGSWGLLILNQEAVNALIDPPPFVPTSAEQASYGLVFDGNVLTNNGSDPDASLAGLPGGAAPYVGGHLMALFDNDEDMDMDATNGICWVSNSIPPPLKAALSPLGGVAYEACP